MLLAILVVPGLVLADEVHLVAHFPLDEGRGALVRDIGPNALRAEVHGARWVQAGKVSLLAFDGEDDYVCCENSDVLAFCGPMTLTAWVWPGEVPVGEVGIAGQHFSSYLLTYYKDRKAWWYIGSSTNHTTAPVLPGTWSHIAATFDGERLRLYVNGELVDTVNSSFATFSTGGPFYIGCLLGRPGAEDLQEAQAGFFKGSIADVRLYAGILSAEAIRAQYAAEVQDRLAPLMAECRRIQTGVTIADGSLRVRIGRSGAIQIARGEGYCVVESGFSEPGKKIAWHWLAETPEAWGCDIKRLNPQAACVIAQGKFYTLERRVSIYPYRVQIEDTLTNLTDEPIGVLVKHCVLTPWFISKARLGTGSA
ncbi:MAG: LamG domain-containing protein, partial [Candidatus Zipacnadales bacterium]